jgi:hypothetical protein
LFFVHEKEDLEESFNLVSQFGEEAFPPFFANSSCWNINDGQVEIVYSRSTVKRSTTLAIEEISWAKVLHL